MITSEIIEGYITNIENGIYTLPDQLLHVEGYSSPKIRELLNRINGHATSYLEVGVHVGSTFIPAVAGHDNLVSFAVDFWRDDYITPMLGVNRLSRFVDNISSHVPGHDIRIVNQDAYTVDLSIFSGNSPDVYFFDGDHSYDSQYKGLTYYAPALAQRFVLLVDDFNWPDTIGGTRSAIRDLSWKTLYERILPGPYNGSSEAWWNALYVGIIEK